MCVSSLLPRCEFQPKTVMEDNMNQDFHDINLHKRCLNEDDASSVNTDIPSDPWFDEQDINFCKSFQNFNQIVNSNNENNSLFYSGGLDESYLKEKEIDLYSDLIITEDAEKRSKLQNDSEVESLKKEFEKLKEADADKNVKICELMKENTNLKKSICSLYQTVKSEIEHKDQLLAEANRKIDSLLFRRNSQNVRYDGTAKNSGFTKDLDSTNRNSQKRKRSESPKSSHNDKGSKSNVAKSRNSNLESGKSTQLVSSSDCNKSNYNGNHPSEKNCQRATLQTPETFKFPDNSRDSTETNNLFFDLIPSPLRKAFYEYEQSQIVSLNRLKQSFLNEYFSTDKSIPSDLENTQKRPKSQRTFHGNQKISGPVNTPIFTEIDKAAMSNKSNDERTSKITRSMQKDLVSLFRYKKERIPFLDKRKFGLLKEGKDLVPEN